MTNLKSILKSRDITLPTKVCLVKAMVFRVVMYECESWIIKKAECWRIDAFELWCWRRLLRVPWTARTILKEISPEYSLERLMLSWNTNTLAMFCKELTHLKRPWCWEWLKAGGKETTEDEMVDGITSSLERSLSKLQEFVLWWTGRPSVLQSIGSKWVGHDWVTELYFSNQMWTNGNCNFYNHSEIIVNT